MAASSGESALIGLCDGEVDSRKYPSCSLTNKVGDLPDIPPGISWQHPRCSVCRAPLSHVVQVYCPLAASAFHRSLHLFACSSALCNGRTESWKVFRTQCLETEMKAASTPQPPRDTQTKQVTMATTDWCDGADDWGMESDDGGGVLYDKKPAVVNEDAVEPEMEGTTTNSSLDVSTRLQDLSLTGAEDTQQVVPIFRPFYISVVDESDLGGEADLEHAQELLREYEEREGVEVSELENVGGGGEGGEEKYEKTKARHGDAIFSRFMKTISLCPEQILRYCWSGKPLFISEPPSNMAKMVPVCSICGSSRTFEFQLMPALVNLLQSKDSNSEMVLEFGTVLVYTCRRSCWTTGSTSPLEEFVFVQADPDQQLFK
ncbi:programmed cell death protein 2-like [Lampris incognitus]|uniref:programmed cell death protein 2-like n=1 Tax=Lampris incognitus TaxID=2546036 RepID=UPI0024B60D8B|nr:programmed cell death protein 2-like [Lampris incognitus]